MKDNEKLIRQSLNDNEKLRLMVAELQESEATYRAVVESASEAICIAQDGLLKFVNPGGTALTGYSEEELLSKPFIALVYPEDVEELVRIYMMRLRGEYVPPGHRFRMIAKNGTVKWVESWSATIEWKTRPAVMSMIRDVTGQVQAEEALSYSHYRLQQFVQDRTGELQATNAKLTREISEKKRAERALTEHVAMLENLFEKAAEGICVCHSTQIEPFVRFTHWNPRMTEITGYTVEEINQSGWYQKMYPDPDLRCRAIERMDRMRQGDDIRAEEWVVTTKCGSEKHLSISTSVIKEEDGQSHVLAIIQDITEHRRSEQRIRESEERLRLAWETSPDYYSISRLKDGLVVDVNPGFTKLTGYAPDEVVGKKSVEFGLWADPNDRLIIIAELTRNGQVRDFETKFRRKDGEIRTVAVSAGLMNLDGEQHILGIVKDIEEAYRAKQALRESEQKYRLLAENVTDVIFTTDLNLNLTYISPSIERMNDWTVAEWMSLKPSDYLTATSLELVTKTLRDELELQGKPGVDPNRIKTIELEQCRKDGTAFWTEVSVRFLHDERQAIIGIIGATRDISQRKKVDDAIKSIVAGVSGEIGDRFFESSVAQFAKILDADFTFIGEISQIGRKRTVKTIAVYAGGELQENFQYDLTGTPCETAVDGETCSYLRGVAAKFPEDQALRKMNIEAYVGVCLYDSRRKPMGIMASMYLRPLENAEFAESALRIFASRAAAEIERKRAEEALRENEATLRTLLQAAPIGIGQVSADRTLGWTNQLLCSMLGYTIEELSGKAARILYESDAEFLRVGKEKHPQVLKDGTGNVETQFRRKDGTVFDVLLSSSSILHGDLSQGMVFTAMDITERKRAEQQLKRLGAAVEQAGESILITDPLGRILYANPSYAETTGYSVDEAVGQTAAILSTGMNDPTIYTRMWSAIEGGNVWRGRFTNRKKDGTLFEETATISPIRNESGQVVNYVVVGRDVTSEIMLQKQLFQAQKMEAVGTLAGGIAHDFNNLLQAVLGYTDLLLGKKGPKDPDRKNLEVIRHAARDGADLVARILTFSRKVESKVRPIDLNKEVRRVGNLLRRTFPRMIQIDLSLEENLGIIEADPAQIEQMIINLGVNAQHAMPDGGRLIIETSNVSPDDPYAKAQLETEFGQYVLLAISDNGVGVEPQVLDRIFEPFFTTKTDGEGTGLGLAMVHGIVSQHKGHIRCYSEPGMGTSFQIYFPVSSKQILSDMEITREMPAFGSETILLVDDDERIREMAREMIETAGYKLLLARNGEEALEIYSAHKDEISLVVLDLIMPGMGGKRCLEGLLLIDPDIKVLVASGISSTGLNQGEACGGVKVYIPKPYDAKTILGAIRKVLDSNE